MSETNEILFFEGDLVQKKKGYKFPGMIVSAYKTLGGDRRYVVECTAEGAAGCQHIFNGNQLDLNEFREIQDDREVK